MAKEAEKGGSFPGSLAKKARGKTPTHEILLARRLLPPTP
jgi:hypothetical protein